MLQQISLTRRTVGNMRTPLSTSRRSKRSRGTKNTAKPATSQACLNRNWEEEEESGTRKAEDPSTHSTNVTTVYIWLKASRRGWLSSLLHPSGTLYTLSSPLVLLAMKTSQRLVLYAIRTVVNGWRWAGAFNAVCKHGAGRIIRKSPIGFITPFVWRSWFIRRYDHGVGDSPAAEFSKAHTAKAAYSNMCIVVVVFNPSFVSIQINIIKLFF